MSFLSKVATVSMQPNSIPMEVNERPRGEKGAVTVRKTLLKKLFLSWRLGAKRKEATMHKRYVVRHSIIIMSYICKYVLCIIHY